ncbi:MAG: phosphoglycerate kinase [Candidatus Cloacimonetes bacterium]|nr:phosphoglycerate kinase [Candidatus Cloacimonadota bacterium]
MTKQSLKSMLDADLKGKIVLVRMDHNVVKKGKIKDTMRIDATIPTLLHIFKKGGMPILMTHIGRPFNKSTGEITISEGDSVAPIVQYLDTRLSLKGMIADCKAESSEGITDLTPIRAAIRNMQGGHADYIYLPNTRWFKGEEAKDDSAELFAKTLASFADVFINDAFGSWQPHATTVGVARYLSSYAGLLMQKEVAHLEDIFDSRRPMISIVAGAKFDTKIGPLSSLINISDYLVLGGVLYNAYLCVKYGVNIKGVGDDDKELASRFINELKDQAHKIVELSYVVESDSFEKVEEGSYRRICIADLKPGQELGFVLDADPKSLEDKTISSIFASAQTVFINAVMGYTVLFTAGSKAMYNKINENKASRKLFGGGDTIQEFKDLLPGEFSRAVNDANYYFFTGGGAILDAIEKGSPYAMKPVQMLLK